MGIFILFLLCSVLFAAPYVARKKEPVLELMWGVAFFITVALVLVRMIESSPG